MVGSWVQGLRGSRAQGLRGSRVQGLRGSRVQGLNSRFAAFKRCCAAFKDLSSFDLQSQICGFQWGISFFEYCEATERHKVPLEFLIAEGI
jgi:hypothetical protein